MVSKKSVAAAAVCLAVSAGNAVAQDASVSFNKSRLENLLQIKVEVVETLAYHPQLVAAVREQNNSGLSMDTIKERDEKWLAGDEYLFKQMMVNSDVSTILADLIGPNDAYTEAFLTDAQGANVAVFPATSDYWQGDEDKWLLSFNGAQGKTFIGEVEFDNSTNSEQVQVSAPVIDASSNETLGVLVVGVNVSYLKELSE